MFNCHSLCTLFIGTDHQQVQNEKFRKRYGTLCIVDERSSKIEAPRNWKECTEFPVREDPEVNANIEVLQNVTIQQDICQEDFIQEKTQNPSSHLPSEEFVPRYIYKFMCIMNFHKNIDVPIQILIINF